MITNKGKSIISKYLIGQVPSYASYMAIGCGATPLSPTTALGNYSTKESLDFEMFRVPITSRGYVIENGVSKLVLTAQLPTEERYEISEIGLYPAVGNPVVQGTDSKMLYLFNQNEAWEYHANDGTKSVIPLITTRLNSPALGDISVPDKFFIANSDNLIFDEDLRVARLERPRNLNSSIFLRGDTSNIQWGTDSIGNPELMYQTGAEHIHLTNAAIDLTKNSSLDELKIAFSVINKSKTDTTDPKRVRVILEFAGEDHTGNIEPDRYARLSLDIHNATSSPGAGIDWQDFSANRYVTRSVSLKDLYTSTTSFTWTDAKVVRVFVSVLDNSDSPTQNFYVALDGVRVENISSINSVYGLTGYTVTKNGTPTGSPATITKADNTSNYIEFRFVADVQS